MSHRLQLAGVVLLVGVVAMLIWLALAPTPGFVGRLNGPVVVDDSSPSALFVGDSFVAGSGAASQEEAASCLAAKAMGWVCNVDAQAATGFLADGHAVDPGYGRLIDRLPAAKARYLADIIVIDAGRNDARFPNDELKQAISTYLEALRAAWPDAELVVIEPYYMNAQASPLRLPVLKHLRAETDRLGGHVIDPQTEGWILPGGQRRHLDAIDHRYIAQRLVAALRKKGLDNVGVTDQEPH